jgi:tetratricopeptide (TPR) repeat protein
VAAPFTAAAQDALEQYENDRLSLEAARSVLQAPPPPWRGQRSLVNYHVRRANAARRLGDTQQQIGELQLAYSLTAGGDPRVVADLASAEALLGNRDRAIQLREEILQKNISPRWRLSHNAALAGQYSGVGDFNKATAALAAAEKLLDQPLPASTRAVFHENRAQVMHAQGKFAEAEAAIRLALDEHRALGHGNDQARYVRGIIETRYAAALRAQGKLAQAEWVVRQALERTVSDTTRDSLPTARIALELARLMQVQGRYDQALSVAERSLKIVQSRGASSSGYNTSNSRLLIAETQVLLGRYELAVSYFIERSKALEVHPSNSEAQGGSGSVYWAYALMRLGRSGEALNMMLAHARLRERRWGATSYAALEARGFYGYVLMRAGRMKEAQEEFVAAVPPLLEAHQKLSTEEQADVTRATRLNWLLEGYMELLAARAAEGGPEGIKAAAEAFRISDVARGSSVQRAVLLSSSRAAYVIPCSPSLRGKSRTSAIGMRR